MINGGVEAGPNAVLAFRREGYKKTSISLKETLESLFYPGFQKVMKRYWKMGFREFRRSYSRKKFAESLQTLVPEITKFDIAPGGAGVRAQACERKGGLADDFIIYERPGVINVCNAPSPAATASLAIGESIVLKALNQLDRRKDCE
jgi:L-2-hydroxyglutarate oxidase